MAAFSKLFFPPSFSCMVRSPPCPAMALKPSPTSASLSLSIVGEPCGRRERHDVERLTRQYGWDAKLTDLLPALVTDRPKRGSARVHERCKAVYERA